MTYGVPSKDYLFSIEERLKQLAIPNHIFVNSLSEEELAILRLQSDIVLNIQVTDAFSSSLIEHLYASSILVCGDWLPYGIFDIFGIKYYKLPIINMPYILKLIVENIQNEKKRMIGNLPAVYRMSSWKEVTPKLRLLFDNSL